MTPTTPEWRMTQPEAIIDGDAMVETGQWNAYKLDTTYQVHWIGNRSRWWKAVKARKGSENDSNN